MPRSQYATLWEGLYGGTRNVIIHGDWLAASDEHAHGLLAKQYLLCVTAIAQFFLEDERRESVEEMLGTIQELHDILLHLPETPVAIGLAAAICHLCEMAILQGKPRKEGFIPNTCAFLLLKVQDTCTVSDIQKLHALRTGFELIDWNDPSCESMGALLLRCFVNPMFISVDVGRRFLSFVCTLDPVLIPAIQEAFRAGTITATKTWTKHISDIIFRAWKKSAPSCQFAIEEKILGEIVGDALLAANPALSSTSRSMLSSFLSGRRSLEVNDMLSRCIAPRLFQALNSPNPQIRKQAYSLAFLVFPLSGSAWSDVSGMKIEDSDASIQQAMLDAFFTGLSDDCVGVRCTCVAGVARILQVFWEVLPGNVSSAFLKKLTHEVAFDSSAAPVRIAVFQGLTFLCANHLASAELSAVLPVLAPLIHDSNAGVRSSFLDLLLRVKGLRLLKFFDIVPLSHLTARFSLESGSNLCKLTKLLLPSYWPSINADGNKQSTEIATSSVLERAMHFVSTNATAAIVFYGSAVTFASSRQIFYMINSLVKEMNESLLVQKEGAYEKKKRSLEDQSYVTPHNFISLVALIASMLEGIKDDEKKLAHVTTALTESTLTEDVLGSWAKVVDNSASGTMSLLRISSLLPQGAAPQLASQCWEQFCALSLNLEDLADRQLGQSDKHEELKLLLQCLVAWEQREELLQYFQAILTDSTPAELEKAICSLNNLLHVAFAAPAMREQLLEKSEEMSALLQVLCEFGQNQRSAVLLQWYYRLATLMMAGVSHPSVAKDSKPSSNEENSAAARLLVELNQQLENHLTYLASLDGEVTLCKLARQSFTTMLMSGCELTPSVLEGFFTLWLSEISRSSQQSMAPESFTEFCHTFSEAILSDSTAQESLLHLWSEILKTTSAVADSDSGIQTALQSVLSASCKRSAWFAFDPVVESSFEASEAAMIPFLSTVGPASSVFIARMIELSSTPARILIALNTLAVIAETPELQRGIPQQIWPDALSYIEDALKRHALPVEEEEKLQNKIDTLRPNLVSG